MMRLITALCLAWVAQFFAFASEAIAEKRVALLVGNQNYVEAVGPLQNPYNDIAVVGAALRNVGFDVMPLVKDADRRQLLRQVRAFAKRLKAAGPDAVGFFYYSGHGAAETQIGPNYLIPTDVQSTGDSGIWDVSVRLNKIIDILTQNAPNAAHFVVFDACRNELKTRDKSISKGFIAEADVDGVYIAFSTAQNRKASDIGRASGPYAKALADELVRHGQHHHDLFFNVKTTVNKAIGQTPWESDGLLRRIYFASRMPQGNPSVTASAVTDNPDLSERALDRGFWKRIQNSEDPEDFKSYLRQFPNGLFEQSARQKLDTCDAYVAFEEFYPKSVFAKLSTEWRKKNCGPFDPIELARSVQSELTRVGCDPGGVDGRWGRGSQRAMARFNEASGTTLATQKPTTEVLGHLRSSKAPICSQSAAVAPQKRKSSTKPESSSKDRKERVSTNASSKKTCRLETKLECKRRLCPAGGCGLRGSGLCRATKRRRVCG